MEIGRLILRTKQGYSVSVDMIYAGESLTEMGEIVQEDGTSFDDAAWEFLDDLVRTTLAMHPEAIPKKLEALIYDPNSTSRFRSEKLPFGTEEFVSRLEKLRKESDELHQDAVAVAD